MTFFCIANKTKGYFSVIKDLARAQAKLTTQDIPFLCHSILKYIDLDKHVQTIKAVGENTQNKHIAALAKFFKINDQITTQTPKNKNKTQQNKTSLERPRFNEREVSGKKPKI